MAKLEQIIEELNDLINHYQHILDINNEVYVELKEKLAEIEDCHNPKYETDFHDLEMTYDRQLSYEGVIRRLKRIVALAEIRNS